MKNILCVVMAGLVATSVYSAAQSQEQEEISVAELLRRQDAQEKEAERVRREECRKALREHQFNLLKMRRKDWKPGEAFFHPYAS